MKQRFSDSFLQEWRKRYQKINWFSRLIKEDRKDGQTRRDKEHMQKMELKLQKMIDEHRQWMDRNGCKLTAPLWRYDVYDTRTWASSPDFEYYHLMKF